MPHVVPHKPDLDEDVQLIPPYNVILWDSPAHSYLYVISMLQTIFGYSKEKAFGMAVEVDTTGRVIVYTGAFEHAEFRRDQIISFGADPSIPHCKGSMYATLEKV